MSLVQTAERAGRRFAQGSEAERQASHAHDIVKDRPVLSVPSRVEEDYHPWEYHEETVALGSAGLLGASPPGPPGPGWDLFETVQIGSLGVFRYRRPKKRR